MSKKYEVISISGVDESGLIRTRSGGMPYTVEAICATLEQARAKVIELIEMDGVENLGEPLVERRWFLWRASDVELIGFS